MEKMTVAKEEFDKLVFKPAATKQYRCWLRHRRYSRCSKKLFDTSSLLTGGMSMTNIILKHSDGEDGIEDTAADICNSPIKPATGWADAPEGAKEFYVVTSDGLVRRPCLILKNEAGVYDTVAYYHSKKDAEPIVTLKKDEYKIGICR